MTYGKINGNVVSYRSVTIADELKRLMDAKKAIEAKILELQTATNES